MISMNWKRDRADMSLPVSASDDALFVTYLHAQQAALLGAQAGRTCDQRAAVQGISVSADSGVSIAETAVGRHPLSADAVDTRNGLAMASGPRFVKGVNSGIPPRGRPICVG